MKRMDHSDGSKTTNTYDGDGLRRTRIDPDGKIHTYIWDGTDYLGEV